MFLNGDGDPRARPARASRVVDDSFLLLFNAHWEPVPFTIPDGLAAEWRVELDTAEGSAERAGHEVTVAPRALVVLRAEA